jgi:hypothetical protein
MNIDYNKYVIFPYTVKRLRKVYSKPILDKWLDQLAFLFQNGFSFQDSLLEQIDEQMMLYNNFKTYDDFQDLIRTFGKAFDSELEYPSEEGYKIVDSILELIITSSAYAVGEVHDIKYMGEKLKDHMNKMVGYLQTLFDSDDFEVVRVLKVIKEDAAEDLIEECEDAFEDGLYNVLFVKYQKLFEVVSEMHKKCYRALLSNGEKGLQSRMGNVNDELYGSSGGYNPNDSEIKCRNGSLVYELKLLTDKSVASKDLKYKMRVIAEEAVENGETDKTLTAFINGSDAEIDKVRNILTEVCLSGVSILLSLKHGLTIIEDDSLNKERSKRIGAELSAIIKYCGLNGFNIA